jgi:hypothetical protein
METHLAGKDHETSPLQSSTKMISNAEASCSLATLN